MPLFRSVSLGLHQRNAKAIDRKILEETEDIGATRPATEGPLHRSSDSIAPDAAFLSLCIFFIDTSTT